MDKQQGPMYSTGNYTQYFVITYKGKELYTMLCVYVYTYIYTRNIYTHNIVYNTNLCPASLSFPFRGREKSLGSNGEDLGSYPAPPPAAV